MSSAELAQLQGYKKSLRSSLVILAPPETWPSFQHIRTKHITPVRCGPHITLAYPFFEYQHFPHAEKILREALKDVKPFTVAFEKFNYFKNKKKCTLYLEPTMDCMQPLLDLQSKIMACFPMCNEVVKKASKFVPHLSMGDFPTVQDVEQHKNLYQKTWKRVECEIKEIYLISRVADQPYAVRNVVPLLGGATPQEKLVEGAPHFTPTPEK